MALPVLTSGMSFDEAAESVLAYLREHVPMGFWSVTRVENGRQSYLYLGDNVYGLPKGGSHPWEDSYCVHMAAGTAPAVAPRAQEVPVYRDAAVNAAVTIGAYAGAVISEPDGSVFGAICGLDTEPHDEKLLAAEPLLNLLGSLLNMVLGAERARDEAAAAASDARSDAETDLLTGLLNRRGWERSVAAAEDRFARLADPTIVVMVDLDRLKDINDCEGHAAGDRYIVAAGQALRAATRPTDALARLGGDEFGLIMSGCPETAGADKVAHLYAALEQGGVAGSCGWAPIGIVRGFPAALVEADKAMYAAKKARRDDQAIPARRRIGA